jgi:hypothetical protein
VRAGVRPRSRPAIKRPGKIRCALVDALEALGGSATTIEACEKLNRNPKRARDLIRRKKPGSKGRDGLAIMLEDDGVITIDGDVLSLSADWEARLHAARVRGEEATGTAEVTRDDGERVSVTVEGDDERAVADLARKRRAYRNRHKVKAELAPAPGETCERRESYPERRRAHIADALARLFAARPEFRGRRVGQVVCKLPDYLAPDFPRGPDGLPKDHEVEELLEGAAA